MALPERETGRGVPENHPPINERGRLSLQGHRDVLSLYVTTYQLIERTMKLKLFPYFCLGLLLLGGCSKDKEESIDAGQAIPDEIFRDFCLRTYDRNKDGMLSESEIRVAKSFDLRDRGIQSLKGVEIFPFLERLYVSGNLLTELDLSRNTALVDLFCENNLLSKLILSQHPGLARLDCRNNALTRLELSSAVLVHLDCSNNQLTGLDISKNLMLNVLNCQNNQLAQLTTARNMNLTELNCEDNHLTALASHSPNLKWLKCSNNKLSELDLSRNPELTLAECYFNRLATLDISQNTKLEELACHDNQLTELDLSEKPALNLLMCSENRLAKLDVTGSPLLKYLYCSSNALTELDISRNEKLISLSCMFHSGLQTISVWRTFNLQAPEISIPYILKDHWAEFRIKE